MWAKCQSFIKSVDKLQKSTYYIIVGNMQTRRLMGNSLDIYNTLLRIERNNHIAKMKDVYSKRQI